MRDKQKQLTILEKKLLASNNRLTATDTVNMCRKLEHDGTLKRIPPEYARVTNSLGKDKFYLGDYIYEFALTNFFSPMVDSIVTASGGVYIDMNNEISGLDSTKEFYVDYCHLTPFGSQFVAEKFAEKVSSYLQQKDRSRNN